MYDVSLVEALVLVTALVLWVTIVNTAIFVNVACWAAIRIIWQWGWK